MKLQLPKPSKQSPLDTSEYVMGADVVKLLTQASTESTKELVKELGDIQGKADDRVSRWLKETEHWGEKLKEQS